MSRGGWGGDGLSEFYEPAGWIPVSTRNHAKHQKRVKFWFCNFIGNLLGPR